MKSCAALLLAITGLAMVACWLPGDILPPPGDGHHRSDSGIQGHPRIFGDSFAQQAADQRCYTAAIQVHVLTGVPQPEAMKLACGIHSHCRAWRFSDFDGEDPVCTRDECSSIDTHAPCGQSGYPCGYPAGCQPGQ